MSATEVAPSAGVGGLAGILILLVWEAFGPPPAGPPPRPGPPSPDRPPRRAILRPVRRPPRGRPRP